VVKTVPTARGPITLAPPVTLVAGWEVSAKSSLASLRLIDCTACRKIRIRAGIDSKIARALAVERGRVRRDDDLQCLTAGIGHEEWLVIGPPDWSIPSHLTAEADVGSELVTIVDATHARALIRIVGSDSAKVMAKLSSIDFGDRATPNNTALRTSMAGLVVEIVRSDVANRSRDAATPEASSRGYLILCERSAGQHLFNTLLDAGAEFGLDIEGFAGGEMRL
jgi:heterotetrameric sarcosine oxidase gamma subunit